MKIFSGILLLTLLFFSCSEKEKKKNILPENKMREVMWDMVRADQYVSDYLLRDSSRHKKDESVRLYEEIFHIHKISREQFKKSLDYYTSQPDLFRPIIDSLAKRKNNEFTAPSYHPAPVVKDSLVNPLLRKHFQKR